MKEDFHINKNKKLAKDQVKFEIREISGNFVLNNSIKSFKFKIGDVRIWDKVLSSKFAMIMAR